MSRAFTTLWLRANTFILGLQPRQSRQVRTLCEKFFEKGRAYEKARTVVTSTNNQPYRKDENAQHQG